MASFAPRIERRLHQLFELSLLAKALFAGSELLLGLAVLFINLDWVHRSAADLTQHAAGAGLIAHAELWFLNLFQHITPHSQHFWALYLTSHAVVKLAIVLGLVLEVDWAYPGSIVVLFGFIAYQLWRFAHTHALSLIGLTVFDLVVIWLVWHEWQQVRAARRA